MKKRELITILEIVKNLSDEADIDFVFDNGYADGTWFKNVTISPSCSDCSDYKATIVLGGRCTDNEYDVIDVNDNIVYGEKERYIAAINQCGGNMTKAADILGVSSRTVYRKVRRYGI